MSQTRSPVRQAMVAGVVQPRRLHTVCGLAGGESRFPVSPRPLTDAERARILRAQRPIPKAEERVRETLQPPGPIGAPLTACGSSRGTREPARQTTPRSRTGVARGQRGAARRG
jgi:hypothetical protein